MAGRMTGTPGQDMAAKYIESSLSGNGVQIIEPAIGESYVQDFDKYVKKSSRWADDSEVYLAGGDTILPFVGIYIKPSSAAELFGVAPAQMSATMKRSSQPQLRLTTKLFYDSLKARNVISMIEGTDKRDEAVVVIAHYDHLGVRDGKIYNGADDNATGTAAVLEIAEAFSTAAKEGFRPKRSVIFIHSPDDTAEKILYTKMEKIVKGIFATVWELVNR